MASKPSTHSRRKGDAMRQHLTTPIRVGNRRLQPRLVVVIAAILTLLVVFGDTQASAAVHKKKPLSMTNVVIEGGAESAINAPIIYGTEQGLFARYGITATWLNITTGSAADMTAVVSGAAQFAMSGANAEIAAAQQGGPI